MTDESFLTTVIVLNVLLSGGIAWAADQRNRSAVAWFFISFFISPILAILFLALAGRGHGTKIGASTADLGDLSRLSDADLDTIQQHQAAQRAARNQRQNLPRRLE